MSLRWTRLSPAWPLNLVLGREPLAAARRRRSADLLAYLAFTNRPRPARATRVPNWQDRRESNPQPPVLETGALPIELLSFLLRGASPLGLPYSLTRSPLRRLAPF